MFGANYDVVLQGSQAASTTKKQAKDILTRAASVLKTFKEIVAFFQSVKGVDSDTLVEVPQSICCSCCFRL